MRGALFAFILLFAGTARADDSLARLYRGPERPGELVETLSHCDHLLLSAPIRKGQSTRPMPDRDAPMPAIRIADQGRNYDIWDYISVNRVTGLLVLKNGEAAFEDYELGADGGNRWCSFGLAAPVTAALVGAAIKDGLISGIDDPLIRYLPELTGSAYDGVTLRQVLTMTSGVQWNEAADTARLRDAMAAQRAGAAIDLMKRLPRAAPAGDRKNLNSGEILLAGAAVEAVTRKHLSDYLADRIWSAGMGEGAAWWEEGRSGIVFGNSGLIATLRDYARFGQMMLEDGKLLPAGWIEQGYAWQIPPQDDPINAGALQAEGDFGQFLYINPKEKLVIVVLSARSKPSSADRLEISDAAFFKAAARAALGRITTYTDEHRYK